MNQIALICRKAFEQGGAGKVLASTLGLNDDIVLARFRAGYADDSLLQTIPQADGSLREELAELGIIAPGGQLTISGCLIIPAMNRDGKAIGFIAVDFEGRERRFPALLPLYGLNPGSFAGKEAIFTDNVLKLLRYVQAGVLNVAALGEIPGDAETAYLRLNRPGKAYCDVRGQGIPQALQHLEIPCYRMQLEWPATQSQIDEALKAAEPTEVRLGSEGSPFAEDAVAVVLDESLKFRCGGRDYELRDLDPGETGRMRVRLKAVRNGQFHLDTLDLYAARSRGGFAKAACGLYSATPSILESDLCLMIKKLESMRAANRGSGRVRGQGYAMTADEEAEALELLKQPDLLDRIVRDMERLGYVGEETTKRLGFLITISRKLQSPLSGVILSRAGAGKSCLMDVLADMTPPEDLVRFTRLTPQALYYSDPKGLQNKILMSGEDEGLAGSDYAMRELISSKKIRLAVPLNDADSGKLKMEHYEVEGPIALLFSTTKPALHFENATRLFTLSLDEGTDQTQRILESQRRRRTLPGLEEKPLLDDLRRLHQNMQRLLKPLVVINPFAPHLEFPTQPLEMRREHEKYLSLIEAIALLHQHQRALRSAVINGREVEYVEVAVQDIEEANRLMTEILGTGREELSRPSRELLDHVKRMAEEKAAALGIKPTEVRFNRRDIREFTGWSDSQIKSHIGQLEDLEHLLVSRGERGRLYRYELPQDCGKKRLPGLSDTAKLRAMVRKSGMVCQSLAANGEAVLFENSNGTASESLKVWQNPEREGGACVEA